MTSSNEFINEIIMLSDKIGFKKQTCPASIQGCGKNIMHAIESKVNIHSEDYKKNYAAMESLVEDLRREMKRARDERSRKGAGPPG